MKKLVFTDLDGTLLDLKSYSAEHVKSAVHQLKLAGVSIIFCSSKTWAEQETYLRELSLDEPVIVENGSAIFLPEEHDLKFDKKIHKVNGKPAVILGKSYQQVQGAIQSALSSLSLDFNFYFNQSLQQISKTTGLPVEASVNAAARSFSETLFNATSDPEGYATLKSDLHKKRFKCTPGSKFITITGSKSDKGSAVQIVISAYKKIHEQVVSYGIGDSRNDLEMLMAVDHPYLVQKPDCTWAPLDVPNLSKISAVGPKGWVLMADELMSP